MEYQVKHYMRGLLAINFIQNGATVSRETVNEVNMAAGKETTVSIIPRNIVPLLFRTKHVLLKSARSFISWAQRDRDVQKNSHIDDLTINAAAQGTQVAILMPDKITSRVNLIKSPRLTTHKIMQIF